MIETVLGDPGALELILVIDGTDDQRSHDVLEGLDSYRERLIHVCVEQGGQMQALQRGVDIAQGELILLLDDDVLPISALATGHARVHGNHSDLVVVGSMPVGSLDNRSKNVATRIYDSAYEGHCRALLSGDAPVLNSLWMGNVSLRREWCLKVGIHSAAFASGYHSDRDLGYRLADAGLVGVFDPSLRAVHLHRRSAQEFLRDSRRQGSGIRKLHRLHPQRLGPFNVEQVAINAPFPLNRAFPRVANHRWTRRAASRVLLRVGLGAGVVHLDQIETTLAKSAQHLMQWEGAVTGAER